MTEPAILAEGLVKNFGEFTTVGDISFSSLENFMIRAVVKTWKTS